MEIAPTAPVPMTTATEETGDTTTMEVAEATDNNIAMEAEVTTADLRIITAPHTVTKAITTVLTEMTNALITAHASRDMTTGRPKLIPPLLREKRYRAKA
jgi:hypothetical protein